MDLLEVAKSSVPSSVWSLTPVVLSATAGLRLLPEEKAQNLLDTVSHVLNQPRAGAATKHLTSHHHINISMQ